MTTIITKAIAPAITLTTTITMHALKRAVASYIHTYMCGHGGDLFMYVGRDPAIIAPLKRGVIPAVDLSTAVDIYYTTIDPFYMGLFLTPPRDLVSRVVVR